MINYPSSTDASGTNGTGWTHRNEKSTMSEKDARIAPNLNEDVLEKLRKGFKKTEWTDCWGKRGQCPHCGRCSTCGRCPTCGESTVPPPWPTYPWTYPGREGYWPY